MSCLTLKDKFQKIGQTFEMVAGEDKTIDHYELKALVNKLLSPKQ